MNDLWAKLTLLPEVERALAQGAALVISVSGAKTAMPCVNCLPRQGIARQVARMRTYMRTYMPFSSNSK